MSMNTYNLYSKKRPLPWRRFYYFILPFLLLTTFTQQSYAQTKILAEYESKSNNGVSDETNVNTDNNDYAEVKTSSGVALGIGAYSGSLQMKFDETIPANQWSYIRVELDGGLVDVLLGGTLGNALGGIISGIALGDLIVEASALNSETEVLKRNSNQGFDTDRVRLIETGEGHYLIGLKPDQDYNQVKFKASVNSLLGLGNTFTNKVFYAFTYDENDSAGDCGRPLATSFDGSSGIDLTLLNLDNQHLNRAIDDDPNTYSELSNSSLLGLSVASTLSQYFYFPTESAETASVNVKLGMSSSGLLDLDLLGATEIVFYQGSDEVHKRSLKSSLLHNTNALNLLDAGNPVTLTFAPGRKFDRIEFRLNSPVGLNLLSAGFRIYDVERFDDAAGCPNPEIAAVPSATPDPFDEASCASGLIDFDNVDFAQRAVDGNNESYATIYADAGNLLVNGPTTGFIEMDLGETVPANKTTYVRINYDEDVLDRLVGGSLGKLVADLANNLLLGNQYFEVEAKNGNSSVLKEKSSDAFEGTADGTVTLVQDDLGRFYIAITPDSDYDRIRITNHVTAVLSTGKKASLDVYNACFEIGTDNCFPPNFTSYRGGGIGLNVGNISSVGVTNAYRAISENSSEYSEINLGVAGIAANVYQTIHFNKPSQPNDKVKIRLQIEPSSALSLDLLGAYNIKFFNGNTEVEDYSLQDGLINNIDLVMLFRSGGIAELEFEPSSTFDRVDIGAESLVSLNVAAEPLRVYSVARSGDDCPLVIGVPPIESPICAAVLIDAQNADDIQNLFDGDFDSFATLNSGAGSLLGINQLEGFVELGYDHDVPAGTTSYIRIDFEETILEKLVGGSLGNIVSGLLDGLILGDHFFEVDIKHDGNSVAFASSGDASAA